MSSNGSQPHDRSEADELVARNRTASRRRTPGRTPVGQDVTRVLVVVTGAALALATLVLVLVALL